MLSIRGTQARRYPTDINDLLRKASNNIIIIVTIYWPMYKKYLPFLIKEYKNNDCFNSFKYIVAPE